MSGRAFAGVLAVLVGGLAVGVCATNKKTHGSESEDPGRVAPAVAPGSGNPDPEASGGDPGSGTPAPGVPEVDPADSDTDVQMVSETVPSAPETVVHKLVVSKHQGVQWELSLTEIAAEMTRVLRRADQGRHCRQDPADTTCDVRFEIQGEMGEFDYGDGVVLDHADFEAAVSGQSDDDPPESQPTPTEPESVTRVWIVESIRCCGCGVTGKCGPNILGCAGKGSSMLVTAGPLPGCLRRYLDDSTELIDKEKIHARLWLHEFGHTRGLDHRDHCYAVMNPMPTCVSDSVATEEVEAFESRIEPLQTDPILCHLTDYDDISAALAQGLDRTEKLAGRLFVHGPPYQLAKQLPAESRDELAVILRSSDRSDLWENAAQLLGVIGHPSSVMPLIEFVEDQQGLGRPQDFRARLGAIAALGYLVNQSDHPAATEFLRKGVDPKTWERKPAWVPRAIENPSFILVSESLLGLALSKTVDIEEVLAELGEDTFVDWDSRTQDRFQGVLSAARELNAQKPTLEEYLRRER